MAEAMTPEKPREVVRRLLAREGRTMKYLREEVLRIEHPGTLSRKLSGRSPWTALELEKLSAFFGEPEHVFEAKGPVAE